MADAALVAPAAVLWVLLPAYVANAVATLSRGRGPRMDLGRNWPRDGRRILGESKTWLGFAIGVLFPLWIGALETYLVLLAPPSLQIVPAFGPTVLAGMPVVLLLTTGALTGDALGSFLKRRLGISAGGRAPFLDQLLLAAVPIGLGLALYPSIFDPVFLNWAGLFWTLVFTLGLHALFNYVGYWLGLKKVPW